MSAAVVAERPYADYSLERKAEVLALVEANGGNVQLTARETGIPHQTIRFWLTNNGKYSNVQNEKLAALDARLEQTVDKYLDSLHDHDLAQAPLGQKATAFGIIFDKLQLVRNQPTIITQTIDRQEVQVILQTALTESLGVTLDLE